MLGRASLRRTILLYASVLLILLIVSVLGYVNYQAEQFVGERIENDVRRGSERIMSAETEKIADLHLVADLVASVPYSWWSNFANSRTRNIGWRIDYVLVSSPLRSAVKAADIHANVMGSDHCPVSITLDL